MAGDNVKIRFSFEGAAEIKKSFDTISKSAKSAFASVQKYGRDVGRAYDGARASAARLGNSLATTARRITSIFAVAIAGATAASAALYKLAADTANQADEQIKSAQGAGLSVEQWGRLTHALEQAGVKGEQVATTLGKIATASQDAKEQADADIESRLDGEKKLAKLQAKHARLAAGPSSKKNQTNLKKLEKEIKKTESALAKLEEGNGDVYERLGVSLLNDDGSMRGTQDVLFDIADKFEQMPDGVEKTAAAVDLFGQRIGLQMIPLLNQGRAGILKLGDEAEALGIVFTEEQAKSAEAFNDNLDTLKKSIIGFRNYVGNYFIPLFAEAFSTIKDRIMDSAPEIAAWIDKLMVPAADILSDIVSLISGRQIGPGFVSDVVVGFFQLKSSAEELFVTLKTQFAAVRDEFLIPLRETVQEILTVFSDLLAKFGVDIPPERLGIYIAAAKVLGIFSVLTSAIGLAVSSLKLLFVAAGPVFTLLVSTASVLSKVLLAAAGLVSLPVVVAAAVIAALAAVWIFRDEVLAFLTSLGELIGSAFNLAVDLILLAIYGLLVAIGGIGDALKSALATGAEAAWSSIVWLWDRFKEFVEWIATAPARALGALGNLFGAGGKPAGGDVPGYAGGGSVRGPGTGTSDSILARLSDGEYVIRSAAVRRFGSAFFDRLNAGMLPAFAAGGFVGSSVSMEPAGGGARDNLTLVIDGEEYGAQASSATLSDMNRGLRKNSRVRAHRKPGWSK